MTIFNSYFDITRGYIISNILSLSVTLERNWGHGVSKARTMMPQIIMAWLMFALGWLAASGIDIFQRISQSYRNCCYINVVHICSYIPIYPNISHYSSWFIIIYHSYPTRVGFLPITSHPHGLPWSTPQQHTRACFLKVQGMSRSWALQPAGWWLEGIFRIDMDRYYKILQIYI